MGRLLDDKTEIRAMQLQPTKFPELMTTARNQKAARMILGVSEGTWPLLTP